jgi:hypothetical protein
VCWKPCSSCWSFQLLREEFLSAPIHSHSLWFAVSVVHHVAASLQALVVHTTHTRTRLFLTFAAATREGVVVHVFTVATATVGGEGAIVRLELHHRLHQADSSSAAAHRIRVDEGRGSSSVAGSVSVARAGRSSLAAWGGGGKALGEERRRPRRSPRVSPPLRLLRLCTSSASDEC